MPSYAEENVRPQWPEEPCRRERKLVVEPHTCQTKLDRKGQMKCSSWSYRKGAGHGATTCSGMA
jgi:hypothetical protein